MPTRKNNYNPPKLEDERLRWVAVGCGKCIECRQQKARQWQVRLHEEIKNNNTYNYFITLSFSPDALEKLQKETNENEVNKIATFAIRRFLERWRKKYKKSLKHWLVTELGDNYTERIHLHGIIFCEQEHSKEELENIWKYGNIYVGEYCTARTVNYIIKYVHKIDTKHKTYEPVCLCSAGLGKGYITDITKDIHKYRPNKSKEFYTLPNGNKINLPIYYRNKFFNEKEREKLWIEKIEKDTLYVRGIKIRNIHSKQGQKAYFDLLKTQQKENKELGYGDDSKEWKKEKYKITLQMLNKQQKK